MTILGSKFLKKSLNRKPKLVAFKYRIAFATILAADFNCDQFRIMSDIISKNLRAAIAAISCQVVLFHPNLSRRPFLGQVVDWDLLLCTRFNLEHADWFLFPSPTQSQWMRGRLREAMSTAWLVTSSWDFHWKFHFTLKKFRRHCQKFTNH